MKGVGITGGDVALVGMMVAVIEACKFAMAALPNVELTSFWVILFALCFGRRIYLVVPVFILIEGLVYGFGMWWLSYLYVWPLLVAIAMLLRGSDSALFWAAVAGGFGLAFGALCSLPYFFIGGPSAAFAYWVSGIPFDLLHCGGNFAVTFVLYRPVTGILKRAWTENTK